MPKKKPQEKKSVQPASAKKARTKTAKKKPEKSEETKRAEWTERFLRRLVESDWRSPDKWREIYRDWLGGVEPLIDVRIIHDDEVAAHQSGDPVRCSVMASRVARSVADACHRIHDQWRDRAGRKDDPSSEIHAMRFFAVVAQRAQCASDLAIDAAFALRPDLAAKRRELILAEAPQVIIDPDVPTGPAQRRRPRYSFPWSGSVGIPPALLAKAKSVRFEVTWDWLAATWLAPRKFLSYPEIEQLAMTAAAQQDPMSGYPAEICGISYRVSDSVVAALIGVKERSKSRPYSQAYNALARRARLGADLALDAACLLRTDRVRYGPEGARAFLSDLPHPAGQ